MKELDTERRANETLMAAKDAISKLAGSLVEVKKAIKVISQREGDIVITGVGKSGFIGQKIAATLTSLGHRAAFLHPVEAIHGDIGVLSEGDVMISLSFSGESKEVVKITSYAKNNFKVPVVALTKNKNSSLGKLADVCIEIKIKKEGSPNNIAPMASTTATLVLGDMIAAGLTGKSFKDDNFARFHPGGALGLRLKKVQEFAKTGNQIPLVKEKEEFVDVLKVINDKKLGVVGVVNAKGQLTGIITDGDVRRAVIKNTDLKNLRAIDIMTKNPRSIGDKASLELALNLMEQYKITHLFVLNKNQKPVGIIHIHNIIEQTI